MVDWIADTFQVVCCNCVCFTLCRATSSNVVVEDLLSLIYTSSPLEEDLSKVIPGEGMKIGDVEIDLLPLVAWLSIRQQTFAV